MSRLQYLRGVGFYRKKINVPESWQGCQAVLHIGGSRINTWVSINGECRGQKFGGHSFPLEWNLTDKLKPGQENEIVIAVDNCYSGIGGCETWSLYGKSAGIFLPVYLKVSGKGRIADLFVCPVEANKKLKWNVELDGDISGSSIDWAIEDPKNGNIIGKGSTPASGTSVTWATDTFGMKPWSDHSPYLYNLLVTLSADGVKVDEVKQRYGLRSIAADGITLRLNGRPVMLRGVTEAVGYPVTKSPPTEKSFYRETISTMKSIGFNWLRCHTWVPNEEYLKAADEMGMMIQVEQSWGHSPELWESMIQHCRKHPSVVVYCYGNEIPIDDDMLEKLRDYSERERKLAPEVLFSPMEELRWIDIVWPAEESDAAKNFGDGYVVEPFPHNARKLKLIQEFADVLASDTWSMLTWKCVHSDWKEINRRISGYKRPVLIHEIGTLGGYMDPALEYRYEGTPTGANPPMYVHFRRNLTEAGLWKNASRYYLNSCKLVAATRKSCMENARKCRNIGGYNYHTVSDLHWGLMGIPCGILNEFYELKPGESPEDVQKYNGESVVLIDNTNSRNLWPGETREFDAMASLFGALPLKKGTLIWTLSGDSKVYQRGDVKLSNILNGTVTRVCRIKVTAPALDEPKKLTLRLRLTGGEYDVENDWNYWVFPKNDPPAINAAADDVILKQYGSRYECFTPVQGSSASIRFLSSLDKAAVDFMAEGGNVVLLGTKPFPTREVTYQTYWHQKGASMATVVYDHPLTAAFPHDGWCDWQFYSMVDEVSMVNFNYSGLEFNPIVEGVTGYFDVKKLSCLFELRVGNGKLLVCTTKLNLADPASQCMLDNTVRYVASDAFQPAAATTPEHLSSLSMAKIEGGEYVGEGLLRAAK